MRETTDSRLILVVCALTCAVGTCSSAPQRSDDDSPGAAELETGVDDTGLNPGEGASCSTYASPTARGELPEAVDEASGLAVFGGEDAVLWIHNDSGDLARLYALNADGELRMTLLLDGLIAIDWEDMARGPCEPGDVARGCLYVGDIGDNFRLRPWISVHRLRAPDPRPGVQRVVEGVQSMRVRYPDGARDAEALAVDETGRVFIFSKDRDGRFSLYSTPFAEGGGVARLAYHGTFDISSLPGGDRATVTSADYLPAERRLLLRTYNAAIEYRLAPGQGLDELAGTPFSVVPTAEEHQGESIAYGVGGYWHVSEGGGAPLYFVGCGE